MHTNKKKELEMPTGFYADFNRLVLENPTNAKMLDMYGDVEKVRTKISRQLSVPLERVMIPPPHLLDPKTREMILLPFRNEEGEVRDLSSFSLSEKTLVASDEGMQIMINSYLEATVAVCLKFQHTKYISIAKARKTPPVPRKIRCASRKIKRPEHLLDDALALAAWGKETPGAFGRALSDTEGHPKQPGRDVLLYGTRLDEACASKLSESELETLAWAYGFSDSKLICAKVDLIRMQTYMHFGKKVTPPPFLWDATTHELLLRPVWDENNKKMDLSSVRTKKHWRDIQLEVVIDTYLAETFGVVVDRQSDELTFTKPPAGAKNKVWHYGKYVLGGAVVAMTIALTWSLHTAMDRSQWAQKEKLSGSILSQIFVDLPRYTFAMGTALLNGEDVTVVLTDNEQFKPIDVSQKATDVDGGAKVLDALGMNKTNPLTFYGTTVGDWNIKWLAARAQNLIHVVDGPIIGRTPHHVGGPLNKFINENAQRTAQVSLVDLNLDQASMKTQDSENESFNEAYHQYSQAKGGLRPDVPYPSYAVNTNDSGKYSIHGYDADR